VLVTPLYALFRNEFGFSTITLTLVYATYVVGNLIALVLFGGLSDQIGRRPVAIPTIVLAAISTLLFAFAHNTIWLFAARGLSGFAVGVLSGTATAWLADLYAARSKTRASVIAIAANLTGVALGPLAAGFLAQYSPMPLQLPFFGYLAILAVLEAFVVAGPPETVHDPLQTIRQLRLRPRVGIPGEIVARFISPAITIFAIFALCGFYFALLPSVLREALGVKNVAIGGAIVFEMASVSVAVVILTRNWESYRAMLGGLLVLLPALALLVLAEGARNMPLLLISSALTGGSLGLGYRGSLQVINEIAPPDRIPLQLAHRKRRVRSRHCRFRIGRTRRRKKVVRIPNGVHPRPNRTGSVRFPVSGRAEKVTPLGAQKSVRAWWWKIGANTDR
jgi:hypothetical protein